MEISFSDLDHEVFPIMDAKRFKEFMLKAKELPIGERFEEDDLLIGFHREEENVCCIFTTSKYTGGYSEATYSEKTTTVEVFFSTILEYLEKYGI